MSNPRLHKAIKQDSRGDKEIAPLLAAAAGVAAGAAAAHWAHVTSKETLTERVTLKLNSSLTLDVENLETYTPALLFEHMYDELKSDPKRPNLNQIGKDQPSFEIAPLAAAFLAGVAAGAAAYKAGMK